MATKKKTKKISRPKKKPSPPKGKKAVAKTVTPKLPANKTGVRKPVKEKLIGKVSHYYDKIGVAVVKLSAPLKQGDSIRIEGGNRNFSQTVDSMESDREKITVAKKGSEIGIKVSQKTREGYRVYKTA